jgi:hypothetical protein
VREEIKMPSLDKIIDEAQQDVVSDLNSNYSAHNDYPAFLKREVAPVLNKAITNLVKRKEHLALQLNYEFGNISEDEYEKQEEEYLDEPDEIPVKELKRHIRLLFEFSNVFMDAENVSEAFNCRLDIAEKALQELMSEGRTNAGA